MGDHRGQVTTTDVPMIKINSSMEKVMEHPLSEVGTLGNGGAGAEFRTCDP